MYSYIKRLIDVVFALLMLLILLPIFLLVTVLIFIKMGSPVFFIQNRLGKNNAIFRTYKFRSMKSKTLDMISDKSRLTPFGNFLRVSRLDELPQLINILKGDMSFIGPRPLLPEYLPYYSKNESMRHTVTPGLSGLSQINNLNYPDWDVQLQDDIKYATNISFRMDFWILIKTIQRIFQVKKIAGSNSSPRKSFIEFKKGLNKK
jgi:lipopolysaccharide/colanic/teichoic acid biosynthesis glycosyltransferase